MTRRKTSEVKVNFGWMTGCLATIHLALFRTYYGPPRAPWQAVVIMIAALLTVLEVQIQYILFLWTRAMYTSFNMANTASIYSKWIIAGVVVDRLFRYVLVF